MATRKIISQFDEHGIRCHLPRGFGAKVVSPNLGCGLSFARVTRRGLAARLARVQRYLPDAKFPNSETFFQRANAGLEVIKSNPAIAGLLNGPCCHLVFEHRSRHGDHGAYLDERLLPAVAAAYCDQSKAYSFTNYCQGALKNNVTFASKSGKKYLLAKMAEGPVVATFFPRCLQGFSVNADVEQMATLIQPAQGRFILAGPMIFGMGLQIYPEVFGPDVFSFEKKLLVNDCAAARLCNHSFRFWANGGHVRYYNYSDLDTAFDDCAGGLVLVLE